jgi:hypothetical protein
MLVIRPLLSILLFICASTNVQAGEQVPGSRGLPFEMPIILYPASLPRPVNDPITLVVPFQQKLECESAVVGQTINVHALQLVDASGGPVPCSISELPDGKSQLSFQLPTAIPADREERFILHFGTVPAVAEKSAGPTTQPAQEQPGITWEFNEGTKASFPGGTHVTTLEGGGNSGYLSAMADGKESAPRIGVSTIPMDGRMYSHVIMRLRHQGPTATSIAANGVLLHAANGWQQLPDSFDLFEADLAGQNGWGTSADKLVLSFGADQPRPTASDQIIIDWIRVLPRTPIVYADVIARSDPAATGLEVYGSWFRPSTSAAYLYFRNTGEKPVTISKVFVDQYRESNLPWPLDPNRKADWYDILPRVIEPGNVAQLRVHLRGVTRIDPVSLTIESSDGSPASAVIPAVAAPLTFSDITFAKDGSGASLFVSTDATIAKVFVDGRDETSRCNLAGGESFRHVAAVFYRPETPLVRGSYHTWEVRTSDDRRAMYTARTLANDFIIGTYGQTIFQPYKDDGINHYINFNLLTAKKVQELSALGMTASFVPFVGGEIDSKTHEFKMMDESASTLRIQAVKGNAAVAYYSAPDEPDGADHPLGVGTHGRSIVAMREFAAALDPATPCFVQIDNTYRNSNYHVYSEAMDYSSSHRYNLGQEFLAGDRAGMKELRDSASPLPYLWITQLYPIREKIGEHANYNGRDPLPAEMHIQMLEALGGGSKGFIHYIHSGSRGGRGGSGTNKDLWASMAPMHQQIALVGDIAVRSTPVAWVTTSAASVHAAALLADPSNVLVVLTNDGMVSTKAGVTVPEVTGNSVNVSLPSWVQPTKVIEVLPGGKTVDIKFEKQNSGISFRLASMKEGTILWLKGNQ